LPAKSTASAPTPTANDDGWGKAFATVGCLPKTAKAQPEKPAASAPTPATSNYGWGKAIANLQK